MTQTASPGRAIWWTASIALAVLLLMGSLILLAIWPPPRVASWGFTGFQGILGAAIGSMGAIVVYRRPLSRVGWVLFLVALATAVQFVVDLAPLLVISQGGADSAAETWTSWLSNIAWIPPVALLGYLLLIYPDGSPPSGRWSRVGTLLGLASLGTAVVAILSPGGLYNIPEIQNPTGLPGLPSELLLNLAYPVFMGALGLTALSLVARWRRAAPIARAQLKWLALAGLPFVGATMVSAWIQPAEYVAIGFGALIPVAITMAILRDRLFEIDRIISRSIGWAIVTAALAAAFVGLVLVLQAALSGITQGQTLAVAASTLVAFALFQPVRSRVQLVVDRRFDRTRYDAEQMVEGFAGRLRTEVDIPALRSNLVTTTALAVHPASVGVWMRAVNGEAGPAASEGTTAEDGAIPVPSMP